MTFAKNIRPYVETELRLADIAERTGQPDRAFHHLERAHILGQASTREHVRVHWRMLRWAINHRVIREIRGQIMRIVGAATKTAFGLIPTGNTGGADISAFKRLPIPPDLEVSIKKARNSDRPHLPHR